MPVPALPILPPEITQHIVVLCARSMMTASINVSDTSLTVPLLEWDDLLRIWKGLKTIPRQFQKTDSVPKKARGAQFALRLPVATLEGAHGDPSSIPQGAVIYIDPSDTEPRPGKTMIIQVDPYTLLVGVVEISAQGKPRLTLPNFDYPDIDLSSCELVYRGTIVSWDAP